MATRNGATAASTRTPFSLDGQVALVTGAVRGLGLEIARALSSAGAAVVINGRDPQRLEAAATSLRSVGAMIETACFDVTDFAAGERAVADIVSRHGRLDILVNNVGERDRRPIFEFEPDDVRRLLDTNLVAPLMLARSAGDAMIRAGRGRIINVTSIAGPIARSGDASYTAAKGGLAALTRALAAEFGPGGVTVNGIAPGYFATEANAAMVADPATTEWLRGRSSLQRWGRPEEIGGAAVFLASDAASYITGHVLVVDGGISARF